MKYVVFAVCLAAQAQLVAALKPETVKEFDSYQVMVDQELAARLGGTRAFQWLDEHPERRAEVLSGKIVTQALSGPDGRSVSSGLVHDWVGDIYLKGQKVEAVRDFLLDTPRHPAVFADVKEAAVLSREGEHSVTRLRLVKKKVLTVVLDVEYQNEWRALPGGRWTMSARSRKVSEIDGGQALPPDTGHGFLWRMNTFWLLRQDDGGVWVELRSVTLSRDTPRGLGWIIRPIIRNFPAEAILGTLEGTQKALGR